MQVLVLGPLEIRDDNGVSRILSGSRLRTLTTVLALQAGRAVSTDHLIDCLYGDQLPQRAENALQLLVSRLRSALKAAGADGQAIATRSPGYALDLAEDDVDALRFTRLVTEGRACLEQGAVGEGSALLHEALGLWRGPALADFAFDDFATGDRVRLEELRLAATEDCIEADLALGRHGPCAERLEAMVAAHPLRERTWRLLMLALYRSGRQAEALRAFQDARRRLGEELGIDPSPELQGLEAAILAHDPSLTGPSAAPGAPAPGPTVAAGNLARPLTDCIGRHAELAAVHALLETHRLVTLIGPGGTGKTRLAVEAGLTRPDHLDGEVWMVDLAPVAEGQGVVPAVRAALGLQAAGMGDAAGASSAAGLAAAIGDRRPLILLDNCEHVIEEAAAAAADLVAACPELRVLATSRECLGVPGEVLYPVPPLAADAAVRLFTERARASSPDLVFDEPSAEAVVEICSRLDGLPLAIELAAARVRTLHVTQIAARLNDRFRLLTTGPRTLLPRQRTLRAVVDWSYDLLDPAERSLFAQLSVFAGSASLEAVEAVCAGDGIDGQDGDQLLSRLVDKSLVTVVRSSAGNRYSMLQTLTDYAAERLAASGDMDATHRRHVRWVLDLVRSAERGAGAAPAVSLTDLESEVDNVDAALAWARVHDAGAAFELAARLGWFWFWTGRIDLGWQTLAAFLDQPIDVPDDLRARASAWGGMLGTVMQASGGAALVDSAVALGRTSGDDASLGQALAIRGALAILRGEPTGAIPDLAGAGACYSRSGDLHGQGMVCMIQGLAATTEGRTDDAHDRYQRSLDLFLASGDDWAAGVSRQRLAELDERRASSATTPAASAGLNSAPAGFYQAVVRAQLASARSAPATAAGGVSASVTGGDSDRRRAEALAIAVADHIRGRVTLRSDKPADARPVLELALSRYRLQGHVAAVSTCLGDLGRMATAVGDVTGALRFHAEATEAAMQSTDSTVVLSALEALSAALVATGDGERAGFALGAADVLREAGARPWDGDLDLRAPIETAAAALLGDTDLGRARGEGRTMGIEQLLEGLLV